MLSHAQPTPTFKWKDDVNALTREFAALLDAQDPLAHFRENFIIPTKRDLTRTTIVAREEENANSPPCTYLCGNSLGLQPKSTRTYVDRFLQTWATKGVLGHFTNYDDQLGAPYIDVDTKAATLMAPVVGALPGEVAVMDTLTTNLHLLMASFYRPTTEKYKIILEGKAFPSDHFAVESQIQHHNLDPANAMVLIEPDDVDNSLISTENILSVIDEHASSTALILLPGIQYYTGQYFDIARITAHAHSKGIIIGWDCAHAVGNVELQLHDWNVDFAVWCTYKYVNSGPGAMGGLFVHERHGTVDVNGANGLSYRPRLSGWWGGDKEIRFLMDNKFVPRPGAAGFQISNPSILDLSAVIASLELFSAATMPALRQKSLQLTAYMEHLLLNSSPRQQQPDSRLFSIITPSNPLERGAQLSILLREDLLDDVFKRLQDNGIVVDERKPNVIRVAAAPLYNSFAEVWEFCRVFLEACEEVDRENQSRK
ncbi:kynureninase [Paracoccidioides brasiliensis Pb18]|uniref:Kynureninase n=1 Tax=Paracoccidioides brasiliensis (strain Pb18) TaxID=502780 RepID=C1G0F9_PARBD|nr:kynureninase [Paracoccidioides brasiliensis Pb18]EEH44060.1 kynureninase [Paracoccidioides brasiliensis Pb18]